MSNAGKDGDNRRGAMVASVSDIEIASDRVGLLEAVTSHRKQRSIEENRPSIASKLKISVSALERIRGKRRKIVPSWLQDKIRALLIEALQTELRELEHDRDIYLQIGHGLDHDAFRAATAAAIHARELLNRAVAGG